MRPLVRFATRLVAAAVLLGLPGLALAQHAAKAHPKDKDVAGDAAQVAVDRETGTLRQPTREEVEELVGAMSRDLDQSDSGLVVEQRSDGTLAVDLQERFMSVSVARVDGAGVSTQCVSTAGEARAFLEGSAAEPEPGAPPALEER